MTRGKIARAVATAGVAIAAQVASKAARDGIFLGTFDATQLPRAIIAATVVSVLAVAGMGWALRRFGAARTVPGLFFASAALFIVEWWLVGAAPRLGAALVFGHVSSLGALLISGFWSLVSDSFDARSARVHLGTIGVGATLGGLVGGITAERMASAFGAPTLLLVIAMAQLACAFLCATVADTAKQSTDEAVEAPRFALREIVSNQYSRRIALLVILLAVAAGLLDFLFKFEAEAHFESRDQLTRFFGIFYTGTALLAFLLQASLGRRSLERLGLGATAAVLPILLLSGGVGFLLAPGLLAAMLGRGGEMVVRSSLFRSAYELLFAPMQKEQRNRVKAWIDVGCERLGDALAGALVQLLLLSATAGFFIAGSTLALAAAALVAVIWLARGYIGEIADRLSAGDTNIEVDATMATMGLSGLDLSRVLPRREGSGNRNGLPATPVAQPSSDPLAQRAASLRSSNIEEVRKALADPVPTALVPLVIELLSREAVAGNAARALVSVVERHVGQLVDALVDVDEPVAARRRIPGILASASSKRAESGLLAGLADRRFEVRLRCAEALLARRRARGEPLAEGAVSAALIRELEIKTSVRFRGQLSKRGLASPALESRSPKVYLLLTLLALIHPVAPIANAYRALQTRDKKLRGLAIEYLASVASSEIRGSLLEHLDASAHSETTSSIDALEQSLLGSRDAIDAALADAALADEEIT